MCWLKKKEKKIKHLWLNKAKWKNELSFCCLIQNKMFWFKTKCFFFLLSFEGNKNKFFRILISFEKLFSIKKNSVPFFEHHSGRAFPVNASLEIRFHELFQLPKAEPWRGLWIRQQIVVNHWGLSQQDSEPLWYQKQTSVFSWEINRESSVCSNRSCGRFFIGYIISLKREKTLKTLCLSSVCAILMQPILAAAVKASLLYHTRCYTGQFSRCYTATGPVPRSLTLVWFC